MGIAADRGVGSINCFQTKSFHYFDFPNYQTPDEEKFVL